MKTKARKSVWTTYRITGYTHQVGEDQRATGGVHLHQVRRTAQGWQTRVVDSNGRYRSAGPASPLTDAEGAARHAQAEEA